MLNKEPTVVLGALSEVVRAIIPTLIMFGLIHWTGDQVAQIMLLVGVVVKSLEMVLARSQVVPNAVADRQIEIAKASDVRTPTSEIIAAAKESL